MSGDTLFDEISDELTVEQQIEMTARVPKEFEKEFLDERLRELGRKAYDLHRSGRLREEAEMRRRMEQVRQSLLKLSR